jgi:biopolymer transport protein ExbD
VNFNPPHTASKRGLIRLGLTPLIDVIFLLLIFFLITSSTERDESSLDASLRAEQKGDGATSDLQPQVVSAILRDGVPAFQLGSRTTTDRAELLRWLDPLPKDSGVFVKASSRLTVDTAAELLQAVRDAGFDRVTYLPAP